MLKLILAFVLSISFTLSNAEVPKTIILSLEKASETFLGNINHIAEENKKIKPIL